MKRIFRSAAHSPCHQYTADLSRRSFLAIASAAPFIPLRALANHPKTVHFLGRSSGVDRDTLLQFTRRSNLDVKADNYTNDAQFIAKFLGDDPRYDVAMAPDESISHLLHTELLRTLDRALIPNAGQLNPAIPAPGYDPERSYVLPYMWETVGIAYRKSVVRDTPESWEVLLESGRYGGQIALLAESTTTLQVAQKYLGHSINSGAPGSINAASELLMRQKPHIKSFTTSPADLLLSGEANVVMLWSGDFLRQMGGSTKFGFAVPEEGTIIRQKLLCIPKHATDPVAAHRLINFLLDKDIAASLAKRFHFATTNREAAELLGEKYSSDPALSPPPAVLKRSECRGFIHDAKLNRLYKATWERITKR